MTNAPDYLIDVRTTPDWQQRAVARLREQGYLALRGLFDADSLERLRKDVDAFSEQPALAGVPGYAKVDHPKRIFNPFTMGGGVVDMMLDERVIDLIEAHMKSECVLAEANVKIDAGVGYVYFPFHADFTVGWRKSKDSDFVLSEEDMSHPIGIGGAIYLHDTTEGAFSYCEGTHKLMAARGQNLDDYPEPERSEILKKKVRVEGSLGDFVLFDDRGFHGPDQPSRAQRTLVLLDYYRVETFGRMQVTPMPIWSSDLGRMSAKQMRVAGAGAHYMVPPAKYMHTRFRRSPIFGLARRLVEYGFVGQHLRQTVKAKLPLRR